jgi:hypothetical protein
MTYYATTTSSSTADTYVNVYTDTILLSGVCVPTPGQGPAGMFTYPTYTSTTGFMGWPKLRDYTKFVNLVTSNLPGFVLIQIDHARNRRAIVKKHEALKALYIIYERLGYRTTTDIIHVRDLQYTDSEFSLVIKPATCSEEILEELYITQPDLQTLLTDTFGA